MSVSRKWPTSSACTRITLRRAPLKLKCSTSHFKHCAAAERSTRNPQIWLESLRNEKFHEFHHFHQKRALIRLHMCIRISRHREATDLRLSPSDSLYSTVHGKILRIQNEFSDLKILKNFFTK